MSEFLAGKEPQPFLFFAFSMTSKLFSKHIGLNLMVNNGLCSAVKFEKPALIRYFSLSLCLLTPMFDSAGRRPSLFSLRSVLHWQIFFVLLSYLSHDVLARQHSRPSSLPCVDSIYTTAPSTFPPSFLQTQQPKRILQHTSIIVTQDTGSIHK
jgi:hypothetical protein